MMFVYMRYTHPDIAYHTVEGPFRTLRELYEDVAETHDHGDDEDDDCKMQWGADGMFASNKFEQYVYVHELEDLEEVK